MSVALSQGLHVDLDWWQSQEGLSILSLLKEHPSQQTAKFFGKSNVFGVMKILNLACLRVFRISKPSQRSSDIQRRAT